MHSLTRLTRVFSQSQLHIISSSISTEPNEAALSVKLKIKQNVQDNVQTLCTWQMNVTDDSSLGGPKYVIMRFKPPNAKLFKCHKRYRTIYNENSAKYRPYLDLFPYLHDVAVTEISKETYQDIKNMQYSISSPHPSLCSLPRERFVTVP